MKPLDYILKHYQESENEGAGSVLKSLVFALNHEELKTLQRKIIQCGRYRYWFSNDLYEQADFVLKRKNESITSLLNDLDSKDNVTRLDARYRLRDRFKEQSHVTQTQIIRAFLHGSKEDRRWAYENCNYINHYNWDDSLLDDFKFVWEKHEEKQCARIIIQHFPVDYLIENIASLYPSENYEALCVRLRNHPLFNLEIDRLKERYGNHDLGFLLVQAKSHGTIEKGKASEILYKLIAHFINENKSVPKLYRCGMSMETCLMLGDVSTALFYDIVTVLNCMGQLGLVDELLAYRKWDKKITLIYNKRMRLWEKEKIFLSDNEKWKLYCSVIVEYMPREYNHFISGYVRSASTTLPDFKDTSS